MKETFSAGHGQGTRDHEEEIKRLQAKVGELVIERDFLAKALRIAERGSEASDDRTRTRKA